MESMVWPDAVAISPPFSQGNHGRDWQGPQPAVAAKSWIVTGSPLLAQVHHAGDFVAFDSSSAQAAANDDEADSDHRTSGCDQSSGISYCRRDAAHSTPAFKLQDAGAVKLQGSNRAVRSEGEPALHTSDGIYLQPQLEAMPMVGLDDAQLQSETASILSGFRAALARTMQLRKSVASISLNSAIDYERIASLGANLHGGQGAGPSIQHAHQSPALAQLYASDLLNSPMADYDLSVSSSSTSNALGQVFANMQPTSPKRSALSSDPAGMLGRAGHSSKESSPGQAAEHQSEARQLPITPMSGSASSFTAALFGADSASAAADTHFMASLSSHAPESASSALNGTGKGDKTNTPGIRPMSQMLQLRGLHGHTLPTATAGSPPDRSMLLSWEQLALAGMHVQGHVTVSTSAAGAFGHKPGQQVAAMPPATTPTGQGADLYTLLFGSPSPAPSAASVGPGISQGFGFGSGAGYDEHSTGPSPSGGISPPIYSSAAANPHAVQGFAPHFAGGSNSAGPLARAHDPHASLQQAGSQLLHAQLEQGRGQDAVGIANAALRLVEYSPSQLSGGMLVDAAALALHDDAASRPAPLATMPDRPLSTNSPDSGPSNDVIAGSQAAVTAGETGSPAETAAVMRGGVVLGELAYEASWASTQLHAEDSLLAAGALLAGNRRTSALEVLPTQSSSEDLVLSCVIPLSQDALATHEAGAADPPETPAPRQQAEEAVHSAVQPAHHVDAASPGLGVMHTPMTGRPAVANEPISASTASGFEAWQQHGQGQQPRPQLASVHGEDGGRVLAAQLLAAYDSPTQAPQAATPGAHAPHGDASMQTVQSKPVRMGVSGAASDLQHLTGHRQAYRRLPQSGQEPEPYAEQEVGAEDGLSSGPSSPCSNLASVPLEVLLRGSRIGSHPAVPAQPGMEGRSGHSMGTPESVSRVLGDSAVEQVTVSPGLVALRTALGLLQAASETPVSVQPAVQQAGYAAAAISRAHVQQDADGADQGPTTPAEERHENRQALQHNLQALVAELGLDSAARLLSPGPAPGNTTGLDRSAISSKRAARTAASRQAMASNQQSHAAGSPTSSVGQPTVSKPHNPSRLMLIQPKLVHGTAATPVSAPLPTPASTGMPFNSPRTHGQSSYRRASYTSGGVGGVAYGAPSMSAAMMAATAADVAELLEIQSTTELATAAVAKALARVVKLSRENDALARLNAQQSRELAEQHSALSEQQARVKMVYNISAQKGSEVRAQLGDVQMQLAARMLRISELESQLAAAEQRSKQRDSSEQSDREGIKAQLQAKEDQHAQHIQEVKAQHAALLADKDAEATASLAERNSLQEQLQHVQGMVGKLQQHIAETSAREAQSAAEGTATQTVHEKQRHHLQQKLDAAKARNVLLSAERQEASEQMHAKEKAWQEMQARMHAAEAESAQLRQKLQVADVAAGAELAAATAQVQQLQQQLSAAQAAAHAAKARVHDAQEQAHASMEEAADWRSQLSSALEDIHQLRQEVTAAAAAGAEDAAALAISCQALKAQLQEAQDALAADQEAVGAAEQRAREAESRAAQTKNALKEAKAARSEAESQARDLRTQLATAHASMSKMQAELDEEEDLRNKVLDLEEQLASTRQSMATIQAQASRTTSEAKLKARQQEHERDTLQAQLAALRTDLSAHAESVCTLMESKDSATAQAEAAAAQVESLQTQAMELLEARARLRDELDAANAEVSTKEAQLQQLAIQHIAAQQAVQDQAQQLSELAARSEELQAALHVRANELSEVTEDAEHMRSQLDDANLQLQQHVVAIQTSTAALAASEAQLAQFADSLRDEHSRLQAAQEAVAEAELKAGSLATQLGLAQGQAEQLQVEIDVLQGQLDESADALAAAKVMHGQEMQELHIQMQALHAAHAEDTDSASADAKTQVQAALTGAQKEIQELTAHHARLVLELQAADTERVRLRQELARRSPSKQHQQAAHSQPLTPVSAPQVEAESATANHSGMSACSQGMSGNAVADDMTQEERYSVSRTGLANPLFSPLASPKHSSDLAMHLEDAFAAVHASTTEHTHSQDMVPGLQPAYGGAAGGSTPQGLARGRPTVMSVNGDGNGQMPYATGLGAGMLAPWRTAESHARSAWTGGHDASMQSVMTSVLDLKFAMQRAEQAVHEMGGLLLETSAGRHANSMQSSHAHINRASGYLPSAAGRVSSCGGGADYERGWLLDNITGLTARCGAVTSRLGQCLDALGALQLQQHHGMQLGTVHAQSGDSMRVAGGQSHESVQAGVQVAVQLRDELQALQGMLHDAMRRADDAEEVRQRSEDARTEYRGLVIRLKQELETLSQQLVSERAEYARALEMLSQQLVSERAQHAHALASLDHAHAGRMEPHVQGLAQMQAAAASEHHIALGRAAASSNESQLAVVLSGQQQQHREQSIAVSEHEAQQWQALQALLQAVEDSRKPSKHKSRSENTEAERDHEQHLPDAERLHGHHQGPELESLEVSRQQLVVPGSGSGEGQRCVLVARAAAVLCTLRDENLEMRRALLQVMSSRGIRGQLKSLAADKAALERQLAAEKMVLARQGRAVERLGQENRYLHDLIAQGSTHHANVHSSTQSSAQHDHIHSLSQRPHVNGGNGSSSSYHQRAALSYAPAPDGMSRHVQREDGASLSSGYGPLHGCVYGQSPREVSYSHGAGRYSQAGAAEVGSWVEAGGGWLGPGAGCEVEHSGSGAGSSR